jgi:hypothetical protein
MVSRAAANARGQFDFLRRDRGLARTDGRVHVAKRREERPPPEFERRSHPGARSVRPHVVVELREGGEYALHQLSGGPVVDRSGCGAQRDPQRFQMRSKHEMVRKRWSRLTADSAQVLRRSRRVMDCVSDSATVRLDCRWAGEPQAGTASRDSDQDPGLGLLIRSWRLRNAHGQCSDVDGGTQ